MKKLLVFLVVFGFTVVAEAQERKLTPGHEMFAKAVGSKGEGEEHLKQFIQLFPQLSPPNSGIDSGEKLEKYVRILEPHGCPAPEEGKVCLYDSSAQLWIASLADQRFMKFVTMTPTSTTPVATMGVNGVSESQLRNHWATLEACMAATDAPFYMPEKTRECSIGRHEQVVSHPIGGCADMDLPKELGGRGWVRVKDHLVAVRETGVIAKYELCCNDIHRFVPFRETTTPVPAPAPAQPTPIANAVSEIKVSGEILHKVEGSVRGESEPKGKPWYEWMKPNTKKKKIAWGTAVAAVVACGFVCRSEEETHIKITIR